MPHCMPTSDRLFIPLLSNGWSSRVLPAISTPCLCPATSYSQDTHLSQAPSIRSCMDTCSYPHLLYASLTRSSLHRSSLLSCVHLRKNLQSATRICSPSRALIAKRWKMLPVRRPVIREKRTQLPGKQLVWSQPRLIQPEYGRKRIK